MKKYYSRIADKLLEERLEAKGAVLIVGPKWCGKTTTAKKYAGSVLAMDHPDLSRQYREMAEFSPGALLKGSTPRLIDEWQFAKNIWNAVRYEVDQRGKVGQFILTGSAVPAEMDETMHTGTGRISRLYMRTMSLYESGESSGHVSLTDLFEGKEIQGYDETKPEDIAFLICRGGWPESVDLPEKPALFQAKDYYDAVVSLDISRVDSVARDKEKAMRLLKSYARNLSTQSTLETVRRDMLANHPDSFDSKTLYSYLDALKKIFVIEDCPAWNPNLRSKTAIRTTDTRYFVDPSIATAALGMGPQDLLGDLRTMGMFFENLCIRDLRVYADLLDGTIYHYRDRTDLECDAVIHLRNGSYGLIEVKLGGDRLIDEGAENLLKLAAKIDTDKMKPPAFMMVLCGVAPYAYQRKDGVHIVPVCCLKP